MFEEFLGALIVMGEVKPDKNGKIKMPILKGFNYDIEAIGLSERAYNCLRRVGIKTTNDFIEKYNNSEQIRKIRGCGEQATKDIVNTFFKMHFNNLSESGKKYFLEQLIELN